MPRVLPLALCPLLPEELRSFDDAAAERRALLALGVLLAQVLACCARRVGCAVRQLGHRGHALAEGSPLGPLGGIGPLLALILAVLPVRLGLRGQVGLRAG